MTADSLNAPSAARASRLAVALLALGILGACAYANLAFAVTNPVNFGYFPPFKPNVNANKNLRKDNILTQYVNIAKSLLKGSGYANQWGDATGPTAWKPPAFSTLLAGLVWICDDEWSLAFAILVALQMLSLFVTGLLVLALVRRSAGLRSRPIGEIAAAGLFLLWAYSDFHHWFQCTSDYWLIMLALDLVIAVSLWREPFASKTSAAIWGLFGGLMALINPIAGFTWFVMSALVALQNRSVWRLAIAMVFCGIAMSPWIVRNYLAFGRFIPVKSNLAYELYQSQCLQDDGLLTSATLHASHPGGVQTREGREYRQLSEPAYMDKKRELFLKSVKENPLEYLDRALDRFFGATLWYTQYDARRPWATGAMGVLWGRLIHPLPFLAAAYLLISAFWRPLSKAHWVVLGVYVFFLTPYIVISYFEPYGMPLLGVKVTLVLFAIERLIWSAAATSKVTSPNSLPIRAA